jgi:hypothetical protein
MDVDDDPRPVPTDVAVPEKVRRAFAKLPAMVRDWVEVPDFSIYFVAFMVFAVALYLRRIRATGGGFVFDEQEAIVANPYVRGHQPLLEAFKRDFWGRTTASSIGSYRPIPNVLWRIFWRLQLWRQGGEGTGVNTPFVWFNIVFHSANAAIVSSMIQTITRRVGTAWLAGGLFCACAILTEAVSGIVGIADVLGGLSLLLALAALLLTPGWIAPAVFASTLFGLLSKESAIVNVGLVPLAALILARDVDPKEPRPWPRAIASLAGAAAALVVYLRIRHDNFHVDIAYDADLAAKGPIGHAMAWLQHYVGGPLLPVDPFNNPLARPEATTIQRVAGALRVYFRGLVQVLVPRHLSPDYSKQQEPLPSLDHVWGWESIAGAVLMVAPPLVGLVLAWISRGKEVVFGVERRIAAFCLMVWPAAFFPLSNIPKLLPTVRAERFWYTPALAICVLVTIAFLLVARRSWIAAAVVATAYLCGQSICARSHANDFNDDLSFWESAAHSVPMNAKAHLNYSVMLGARAQEYRGMTHTQAQEARLVENIRATELAPDWDMALVYVGDTLCQLDRMDEAWTWYVRGFRAAPANTGLMALALDCMSSKNALLRKETEARALATEPQYAGSWLKFMIEDTLRREHLCRDTDEEGDEVSVDVDDIPSIDRAFDGDEATSASGSTSTSTSARASASASSSTSASSSSSSGSHKIKLHAPRGEPSARPPCGVDPQYRPRSLDGDPKGD